nr:hypothetical protein Iba_chr14aCG25210 [Ipomoea batatas]
MSVIGLIQVRSMATWIQGVNVVSWLKICFTFLQKTGKSSGTLPTMACSDFALLILNMIGERARSNTSSSSTVLHLWTDRNNHGSFSLPIVYLVTLLVISMLLKDHLVSLWEGKAFKSFGRSIKLISPCMVTSIIMKGLVPFTRTFVRIKSNASTKAP